MPHSQDGAPHTIPPNSTECKHPNKFPGLRHTSKYLSSITSSKHTRHTRIEVDHPGSANATPSQKDQPRTCPPSNVRVEHDMNDRMMHDLTALDPNRILRLRDRRRDSQLDLVRKRILVHFRDSAHHVAVHEAVLVDHEALVEDRARGRPVELPLGGVHAQAEADAVALRVQL